MNQSTNTSSQIPTSQFLLKDNIQMLWEIVSDKDSSPQVEQMFRQIVFEFNEREKRAHTNLMAMNKYFITTFVTLLNTMTNGKPMERKNKQQNTSFNGTSFNGVPHNGVPHNGVPVTQEQWQEQRKIQFEKELATMKQDLAAVLKPSVPSPPKFTENIDEPMDDRIIKQRMLEREKEYDAYKPPPESVGLHSPENRIQNVLKELEKLVQPEKVSIRIEEPVTNEVLVEELPFTPLHKKHIHWGSNEEHTIASPSRITPDLSTLYDMMIAQKNQLDSLFHMVTELYHERRVASP